MPPIVRSRPDRAGDCTVGFGPDAAGLRRAVHACRAAGARARVLGVRNRKGRVDTACDAALRSEVGRQVRQLRIMSAAPNTSALPAMRSLQSSTRSP